MCQEELTYHDPCNLFCYLVPCCRSLPLKKGAQMIIACDLDGCLVNFNRGYGELFRYRVKKRFPPYDDPEFPPVWDWPEHYGASKGEVDRVWSFIYDSPRFWEDLRPLPDGQRALLLLSLMRKQGHEIYFLTTRKGWNVKGQTWRWLKHHGYSDPTVLICADGHPNKGHICEGLGVDVMIDDKPENLTYCPRRTHTYLVDYPHNREYTPPLGNPPNFHTRVRNVSEALIKEDM